ncbi:MAG: Re/Si-specific NAD(P)(+) transhydrogenase subunit alpha [Promicromonosporaceae bacterium]|nr:Re/Si-specific NAD(P)(+) transhydrogenase subunit alpha [Promicromonosporaceae bacterium]
MRIGVLKEADGDLVALTPANIPKLTKLGYGVVVETGAGGRANFTDAAYQSAGAEVAEAPEVWDAEVVVGVRAPAEPNRLTRDHTLIAQLAPAANPELVGVLRESGSTALALDAVPRISRAQSLDVLSSMSNLAGYRAVIEAANEYQGMFGGQVTAAGKTQPAKVFVIGGGVAGLAAIGTAVSLGAEVRAFDVRPEAAEQIESVGARFLTTPAAQQEISADGYASELSDAQQRATEELYAEQAEWADIVITTALVRGMAPRTLTNEMIARMRPGSVIVDLAASGGGNAEATVPGERMVTANGVVVLGYLDLAARMPAQASQLYGSNVGNLLALLTPGKDGELVLDLVDPVQRGMAVTHGGELLWPPPPVAVSAGVSDSTTMAPLSAAEKAALAEAKAAEVAEATRVRGQRLLIGGALVAVLLLLLLTFSDALFLNNFLVLILSIVIGFYVISNVTPALHTPLMSQTNAISGIVIVGVLLMLGSGNLAVTIIAVLAATLASVNLFGGFMVTRRMIAMFRKD